VYYDVVVSFSVAMPQHCSVCDDTEGDVPRSFTGNSVALHSVSGQGCWYHFQEPG